MRKPYAHAWTDLTVSVQAFRGWAGSAVTGEAAPEWETEYDRWPEIKRAFADFLDAGHPQEWDSPIVDLLLYILARDNETETLKEQLIERPVHLGALARAGLGSTEADARWQLADALGSAELNAQEAEALLEQFFKDEAEYVSRRALLALARRRSAKADALAIAAWNTGHEYQRMAALKVLSETNSILLARYLDLAEQDGRQYLIASAHRIRVEQAG